MRTAAADIWEEEDCRIDGEWALDTGLRPADWHSTQKRRNFSVVTHCPSTDEFSRSALLGVPLRRSPELMALAEEVARHHESAEFSDEWIEVLADDFAQFDD